MKKLSLLILIFHVVQVSFSQNTAKLDTLLRSYAKLHTFNGSVLVAMKGTILLNKGYGYRNAEKKIMNDEKTVYQLGSVTKQFTSAVILKLQEEKKLDVHDKLSKYFPSYPKGDSITIEQLLTHTSGIYNYTNDGEFMAKEITKPASREKMMALFKDKPLDFSPGTGWNYSNSGYSLLGYIIEIVAKKPYETVVRNYIFTPLQMKHSGFDFIHLASSEKATGYSSVDDTVHETTPIVDSSVSFSAGAIYSTTGDLYRWHKALQANSILSFAQKEKAFTPVRNNYGYGWDIDSIIGKRRVSHGGGIPGFVTKISRVPEDDICIIVLSNGSDATLEEITKSIFSILYNKPYELPKEMTIIKVPEETLKQYIGEYEIQPDYHLNFTIKNGQLMATVPGQPEFVMYAQKDDFYSDKKQETKVEFTRNDKKEVIGFTLHLPGHGGDILCKRIK